MVKHFQDKITTKQVITSIECDKCHHNIKDMFELQEFHHINFTGGYGSIFGDMNKIECDICQHCLKELIGEFCRIKEY